VKILLVDNGSLEPAATLLLREVAAALAARTGREILPVSLLHSDRVPAERLGGVPAETVETVWRREAARGVTDFVTVPFFIGPSRALTDYLPDLAVKVRGDFPGLRVDVAGPLYESGDDRLVRILAERVQAVLTPEFTGGGRVRVALVDHGSPVPAVTAVRDALAVKLAGTLGEGVTAVAPCSMERRPGSEYDFNEPLLAGLLARERWNEGAVVVAQLFLTPGRHAGPEGDVAQICARAQAAAPGLRIARTEVLGTHPRLIDVLADRLAAVWWEK